MLASFKLRFPTPTVVTAGKQFTLIDSAIACMVEAQANADDTMR
jgi:hypothetical protein